MKRSLLLLVVMMPAASCSKKSITAAPAPLRQDILATVGAAQITVSDFESYAVERNTPDSAAARTALLEEMIAEEGLIHAAKSEGLDQTPEYRRAMRRFLITRLEERRLQPLLAQAEILSDADLDKACQQEASRFTQPAARRYAWLRVVAEGADAAMAGTRIQSALLNFRALPEDPNRPGFGAVAAEFSDDGDTRYQGGDLGWLTPEQLATRIPSDACGQVANLKPGQTSDPIRLADGFCVILSTAERAAIPLAKRDLRERVKYELITRRRAEARAAFLLASRSGLKIGISQEKLDSTRIQQPASAVIAPPDQ